ncbi:MAG: hypothetical protein EA391_04935 [Balneolaceae bacterium]|nr:MAG: hypothetical protein EA391_04935 [Balneolaceae bacterium]
MRPEGPCLGICYSDNHLFYSVSDPGQSARLLRIGSVDFGFDVATSIVKEDVEGFPALKKAIENLKEQFSCNSVKLLTPATQECWTVVPRSVYDDASEREAHIQLLMRGSERSEVQAIWHTVSNSDSKLLLLRDNSSIKGIHTLLNAFSTTELVAEFEIGIDWQAHTANRGSYLMIQCHKNYLSVASFILGKLRGCTYIEFEHLNDLAYLWNLYSQNLSWMRGMHDDAFVFGEYAANVINLMSTYWSDHGELHILNTLESMGVDAPEKTYGFRLESSFPAVLMSLDISEIPNTLLL